MANIYNCERIKDRIMNHSHYGNCFNGNVYDIFSSKRENLRKCREYYDEAINTEREIINSNYRNKNLEKNINNLKTISKTKYENTEQKYKAEEETASLEYENKIQSIIKSSEIDKIQNDNLLNLLDIDISNLKLEIDKLKDKFVKEVEYKKKEWELNEKMEKKNFELYQEWKEKQMEKKIDLLEKWKNKIQMKKENMQKKEKYNQNDIDIDEEILDSENYQLDSQKSLKEKKEEKTKTKEMEKKDLLGNKRKIY